MAKRYLAMLLLLSFTTGCGSVSRGVRALLPPPPEVIPIAGWPGGLIVEPGNRGVRLAILPAVRIKVEGDDRFRAGVLADVRRMASSPDAGASILARSLLLVAMNHLSGMKSAAVTIRDPGAGGHADIEAILAHQLGRANRKLARAAGDLGCSLETPRRVERRIRSRKAGGR